MFSFCTVLTSKVISKFQAAKLSGPIFIKKNSTYSYTGQLNKSSFSFKFLSIPLFSLLPFTILATFMNHTILLYNILVFSHLFGLKTILHTFTAFEQNIDVVFQDKYSASVSFYLFVLFHSQCFCISNFLKFFSFCIFLFFKYFRLVHVRMSVR
jgi:hypothetical protein